MARRNPYETQSKLSLALGAAGLLCFLVAAVGVFYKFDYQDFVVAMDSQGMRFLGVIGATAAAVVTGGIGALLGFNAAERKQNPRTGAAWMGFFLSSAALTLALCLFVVFWFAKDLVRR